MKTDYILEEVRRVRREYAEQFGFDLNALVTDLRKCEQEHPGRLVSFPPKPARHACAAHGFIERRSSK